MQRGVLGASARTLPRQARHREYQRAQDEGRPPPPGAPLVSKHRNHHAPGRHGLHADAAQDRAVEEDRSEALITHRFKLNEILDAYETFANAATTRAEGHCRSVNAGPRGRSSFRTKRASLRRLQQQVSLPRAGKRAFTRQDRRPDHSACFLAEVQKMSVLRGSEQCWTMSHAKLSICRQYAICWERAVGRPPAAPGGPIATPLSQNHGRTVRRIPVPRAGFDLTWVNAWCAAQGCSTLFTCRGMRVLRRDRGRRSRRLGRCCRRRLLGRC